MIDIDNEIKTAMLEDKRFRLSVLRSLKAAMANVMFAKGRNGKPLTKDEEYGVVRKQIAQRKESIEMWTKANRSQQADAEKYEIEVLESFLPTPLSDEMLVIAVDNAIRAVGATTKKDMGKVMAKVKEITEGAADPKKVSQLVSAALN